MPHNGRYRTCAREVERAYATYAQTYPQGFTPLGAASFTSVNIAHVVLDVPLDEHFDFRVPDGLDAPVGALVLVPFGRARKVGVVVGHARTSAVPPARLKDVQARIDDVEPLRPAELELFEFCAAYYQRPLGEVIAASLPPRLRQVSRRSLAVAEAPSGTPTFAEKMALSGAQQEALDRIWAGHDRFHPVLLQGVTGSGK